MGSKQADLGAGEGPQRGGRTRARSQEHLAVPQHLDATDGRVVRSPERDLDISHA